MVADPERGNESESRQIKTSSIPVENDPYLDAADRLERAIDTQIAIINGIDEKAEHITRLLGILIGLLFSILSLVIQIDSIGFGRVTLPVEIAFALGVFSLLLAMVAAIVTYLSSKFRIGLHQNVGYYLSQPNTETEYDEHIRRVLGSYGSILEQNKHVLETNSRRFRRTLVFLLLGVLFLSTAGTLHIGQISGLTGVVGLTGSGVFGGIAAWYILAGKYLTLETQISNDE